MITSFPKNASLFASALMVLTLAPGFWTFANAPLANLSSDMISGKTQRQYEERFDDNVPMRDILRHSWTALKYVALNEVAEGAVVGKHGVFFTAEEFLPPNNDRNFSAELRRVRTQVEATGAKLVPVIVPDKARMMSDEIATKRSAPFSERYERALDIILSAGLTTVDLRPALAGKQSFMKTDTHWSPEGAHAAAQAIASILSADLEGSTGFETKQTGQIQLKGDLLNFVDTGPWRDYIGPYHEEMNAYETSQRDLDGLGLFDEVETPVVLVGTSFSARTEFHFVGFLKSELQADVISFAEEGQGPFAPMDRFLGDAANLSTPPKIVLWEIPERYLNTWNYDQ